MNGETIAIIVISVLLMVAGGYIKRLIDELHQLVTVIKDALEDGTVTAEELALIFKEAKDVKQVLFEIIKLIARR